MTRAPARGSRPLERVWLTFRASFPRAAGRAIMQAMPTRNTCQRVVGRLMEIRVDSGYRSPEDIDEMVALMKSIFDLLPAHERIIIAADWRRCTVMGPGTVERARAMFAATNPRVLRSGILISADSPTTVMQLMRIVSEAKLPDRQVFTSSEPHARWLEEVTTPKEQARLKVFLARG
jgi:hypothetical protein